MIKPIKKVSPNRKKYKINNFKDITFKAENLTVCQDKIAVGESFADALLFIPKTQITHFFSFNNKHFLVDVQNYLYRCQTSSYTRIRQLETPNVDLVPVKIYGQDEVLVVGDAGGFIAGQNEDIPNFPTSRVVCFHKGRIFSASGKTITFFNQFDFENFSANFTVSGTITLDNEAGEIQGFMSKGENLYCVCKHEIYKIKSASETIDFLVEKMGFFGLDIIEKSFVSSCGHCFFISNGKLYIFDGQLKKKTILLDNFKHTPVSHAKINKNRYFLTVKDEQSKEVCYSYDLLTESESFIVPKQNIIAGDEYMVIDGKVKAFNGAKGLVDKIYTTKPIVIADGITTLCSMKVEVGSACTLKISGDFGNKQYSLSKGFNDILINLKSSSLVLEFTAQNQDFYIDNLCLIYKEKGE